MEFMDVFAVTYLSPNVAPAITSSCNSNSRLVQRKGITQPFCTVTDHSHSFPPLAFTATEAPGALFTHTHK